MLREATADDADELARIDACENPSAWTVQGFRGAIKKLLRMLDLYECGKSVHALRHSYAVEYYRRSRDLRGLQKQLGHASIQTTTIYADVTKEDIQENIRGFWN